MKNSSSRSRRSRSEILADLATLPPSIQGKISPFSVTTSSGNKTTYHKLQYWANGKNHSIHIPNEKLLLELAGLAAVGRDKPDFKTGGIELAPVALVDREFQ